MAKKCILLFSEIGTGSNCGGWRTTETQREIKYAGVKPLDIEILDIEAFDIELLPAEKLSFQ